MELGKDTQAANLVKDKLEKLADKKRKLVQYKEELLAEIEKTNDIKVAKTVIEENALAFKKGWNKANSATKKRLLRKLVDKLVYLDGGLHATYVTAKENMISELENKVNEASDFISEAYSKTKNVLDAFTQNTSGSLLSKSASVVLSGG